MRRFFLPLFIALATAVAVFIALSAWALPARVATHFAWGGVPNGWMGRESYLAVITLAATLLPLALAALISGLPRAFPQALNVPNRDYWLASERRNAALAALAGFGWALACLVTLFVAGMHWTIVGAHASVPPRLAETHVHALVLGFAVGLGAWLIALLLRFRRMD
jgi:uncharacterized membrane protein